MSKEYPNVMQAIIWIKEAWRELSPQTARNCWIKSGILSVGWAERLKHCSDVEVEQRRIENEVQTLIQSLLLGQDILSVDEYTELPGEKDVTEIPVYTGSCGSCKKNDTDDGSTSEHYLRVTVQSKGIMTL